MGLDLKKVSVHHPNGTVETFEKEKGEIHSAAVLPGTGSILVVNAGPGRFRRFIGFAMVLEEEQTAIDVVADMPPRGRAA